MSRLARCLANWGRRTVAFAGDGFPDEEAARLVPGHLRFARGDLASVGKPQCLWDGTCHGQYDRELCPQCHSGGLLARGRRAVSPDVDEHLHPIL